MPRAKRPQVPMCQYGAACARKGCVYRHPPKQSAKPTKTCQPVASSSQPICVHFVSGTCSFGAHCKDRHPGAQEAEAFRAHCARIECRFGTACTNRACLYSHDGSGSSFERRARRVLLEEQEPRRHQRSPDDVLGVDNGGTPTSEEALPETRKPHGWWRTELGDETCDPISLEPLNELAYAPFELDGHYFDGAVLATYVVSTSTFENPMTREPMTRESCGRLDSYLERNGLFDEARPRVREAFDLHARTSSTPTDAGGTSGRDVLLRREATTLLHSLFGFERYGASSNTNSYGGGFTIAAAEVYNQQPIGAHGETSSSVGASLADAWARDDDDDGAAFLTTSSRRRAAESDDAATVGDDAEPASSFWDAQPSEEAFPALGGGAETTSGDNQRDGARAAPREGGMATSFAALLSTAPREVGGTGTSATDEDSGTTPRPPVRRTVRMPQELWTTARDPRVFSVRDPLERYRIVSAHAKRSDVVDLHYQSARTAPVVLDAVLGGVLERHDEGCWIVTGTGHHAPTNSHQKLRGHLHSVVREYLWDRGFDFALAKDLNGYAGAFRVYGYVA